MSACEFCDEFAGGCTNAFATRYGQYLADRSIMDTGRFRVVPTLGQIVEGHVLVIPVEHICALASLQNDQMQELEDLSNRLRSTLSDMYGGCVFFEHGVRGQGAGGCGIDHAHLHALPVVADGVLEVLTRQFEGTRIYSLAAIKGSIPKNSPYLFFEDASAKRYVFRVDSLPSQYLRKLVAKSIGKSDWDWRECGYERQFISTMRRLSPILSPVATARG